MALKQPLDASELAALSTYIQQKYGLSAQSSLSSAQAEDILNQLYQRRVKGLIREIYNRCLILFPPMMDTLQNMATRPRAVDTVSRDYPDAGLAGSLTPTKRQYRDNNSPAPQRSPRQEIPKSNQNVVASIPASARRRRGRYPETRRNRPVRCRELVRGRV